MRLWPWGRRARERGGAEALERTREELEKVQAQRGEVEYLADALRRRREMNGWSAAIDAAWRKQ